MSSRNRIGNSNFTNATLTILQMSGSLEAILYGLIGKKLSYFWKRHVAVAHFAIEQGIHCPEGSVRCGGNVTFVLERAADLARAIFGRAVLPGLGVEKDGKIYKDDFATAARNEPYWCKHVAFLLYDFVRFSIGNQSIDELTWHANQLSLTMETAAGRRFVEMTNGWDDLDTRIKRSRQSQILYTPFNLWWTKETATPLRLISFAFHSAKLQISLQSVNKLITLPDDSEFSFEDVRLRKRYAHNAVDDEATRDAVSNLTDLTNTDVEIALIIEYVFLTQAERVHMANAPMCDVISTMQTFEEEISQTVSAGRYGTAKTITTALTLNLPVRALILHFETEEAEARNMLGEFRGAYNEVTEMFEDPIETIRIRINSSDKIVLDADYFRKVQPYGYASSLFPTNTFAYMYSFALDPAALRATGSLPAGKLDSFEIQADVRGHMFHENNKTVTMRVTLLLINLLAANSGLATTSHG